MTYTAHRAMLALLASRWTLDILDATSPQPLRFSELRDAVSGISEKVLAACLDRLVGSGLLERIAHGRNVRYALTDTGVACLSALSPLRTWLDDERAVSRAA